MTLLAWLKDGRLVQDYTPRGAPRRGRVRWQPNSERALCWVVMALSPLAFCAYVWWSVNGR